ncbi:NUDIX domain-containing protein [Rothia sp. P7208]|uniref:NUDIX domain-containing protein n=1 Tax=Rothia sp. P7208 TaxID=3402660 RepID=UPI003AD36A7D
MADTYLSEEELIQFIATLPTRRMAAGALIRNEKNEFLAVQPNYRDGWALPGGTVETGEAPQRGCFREVLEEVGLDLTPGRLLVIFHGLQMGVWGDSSYYFYDGGVIDSDTPINVQSEELLGYRWVALDDAAQYFKHSLADRLRTCYEALETGQMIELSSEDS